MSNNNNSPSWAGAVIFTVAALFMIYQTLPNLALWIESTTVQAKVITLDKNHIEFEYNNTYNDNTYYFSRQWENSTEYETAAKQKNIDVRFSEYFPTDVLIECLDKRKPLAILLIVNAVILFTIFKVFKGLLRPK
ncbi:hypothetical protein LGH70_04795 [Hymenobacter sp. BT635]|uniref:DUF3592 domain-containing protein n=1 Tax=Hymenobacter nitidus TaxID=2880929 RepID=A0ABS8A917_9BACT|nr:hypothetical protein [Hymenobacter nitidus]MCB2376886.1 hypothetical protein [Hymenobacter nitidus]